MFFIFWWVFQGLKYGFNLRVSHYSCRSKSSKVRGLLKTVRILLYGLVFYQRSATDSGILHLTNFWSEIYIFSLIFQVSASFIKRRNLKLFEIVCTVWKSSMTVCALLRFFFTISIEITLKFSKAGFIIPGVHSAIWRFLAKLLAHPLCRGWDAENWRNWLVFRYLAGLVSTAETVPTATDSIRGNRDTNRAE